MKVPTFKSAIIVVLAAAALVMLYATMTPAQGGAAFSDPDRAEMWISGHARKMRIILETRLTQAKINTLEAFMFPPPTDAEKRTALRRVRRQLKNTGFADTDSAVVALDGEIAKLPAP